MKKIDASFEHHKTTEYKFDVNSRGNIFIVKMKKAVYASVVEQLNKYFNIPNGGAIINPLMNIMVNSGKRNSFGLLDLFDL